MLKALCGAIAFHTTTPSHVKQAILQFNQRIDRFMDMRRAGALPHREAQVIRQELGKEGKQLLMDYGPAMPSYYRKTLQELIASLDALAAHS